MNELAEALIWAHHVHGRDVSKTHELAAIGARFGIGFGHLQRFIASPTALAPERGSPQALAAIAEGTAALAAAVAAGTCADGENGTQCANAQNATDAEGAAAQSGDASGEEELLVETALATEVRPGPGP